MMSERVNPRLADFDANKAAHEQQLFENDLYGEAGSTDFSDEARTRVAEADAYERELERINERAGMSEDEAYDSMASEHSNGHMDDLHEQALEENAEFDAAKAAEAQELNERMQADVRIRRMQMLANEIAAISAAEVTADNEARHSQTLKDKQDKLETLLVEFTDTFDYDGFSPQERDEIADRIIDITEVKPAQVKEAQSESKAEESLLPDYTSEQIDSRMNGLKEAKDRMAAEADAEAEYDSEAQQEKMTERLELASAEGLDDVNVDETAPASLEGLEPVEVAVKEGESLEEYEARTGITGTEGLDFVEVDETEENNLKPSRWSYFTPTGAFAQLSSRMHQFRNREKNDSEKGEHETRNVVLATVVGSTAVLALTIFAAKHGLDLPKFGGNGTGDGAREALTGNGGHNRGGNGLNWSDFSPRARRVTNGEGWFSTFKQMGIPKSEWKDVLETAGPKLGKLKEAYFDNQAGEWRISRPGQLSNDALRVIASSSRKNGIDLQ